MADNSGLIVAALEKTDMRLAVSIDAQNSWKEAIRIRGARVKKYRLYERGNHDADITDQMRDMLRLGKEKDDAKLREFNDNYMRIVVDKMAGRLHVSSITTDNDAANDWVNELMEANDWESLEGEINRGAIRDADSYILVDPMTLRWIAEPAYDGFDGIEAIFDTDGKPVWVCRLWSEADSADLAGEENTKTNETMQLVVYQPHQLTFWKGTKEGSEISPVNQVVENSVPGVDETNIVVWKLQDDEGRGIIPFVHFVNQKDNYTSYGESELRPAIPLQNALNRTLHSMIMASEFSAFPVHWSIGQKIDIDGIVPGGVVSLVLTDENGVIPVDIDEKQTEFLKAIRIGSLETTDIEQYTNQIETLVKEISQATQTPIYGITAQGNVSGDALRQLEIGLIGKIKRFQRENTAAIRNLINLTAKVQDTFSIEGADSKAPSFKTVTVEWQSPEILDVAAQIAILVTMRKDAPNLWADNWYRKQVGGLLGMTKVEIDTQSEEVANERSRNILTLTGGDGGIPVA